MNIQLTELQIPVEQECVCGSLLAPAMTLPAVLFVHGWGGSQSQDLSRARDASGLGCVSLTIDLRGHDLSAPRSQTVSRAENLNDLLAAYDWLVERPNVDASAVAVVGISYGGYLAAILSAMRPVRWLALRAPALYKDEGWALPKRQLHADTNLRDYRLGRIAPLENRALHACSRFRGDALIIESERDDIVPRPVIENYKAAFGNALSLTARVIAGADHGLSEKPAQKAYTALLINWLTEMVVGAREDAAKSRLAERNIETQTA
jgi:pimeloyl-ACP methyl ester carboxylesterase